MSNKHTDARVERMFAADRIWACMSIGVLWCLYGFTYWQVSVSQSESGVLAALAVAGGFILLFTTASMVRMVTRYENDKDHVYQLDIYYLDEMKRAKG